MALAVGVVSTALMLILLFLGALDSWDWRIDDALTRITARTGEATDTVAVVLLDQASLDWAEETMGVPWPWPREFYALVTDFAARGEPRALGFDVIYDPDKLNFVGINRTNTTNDFVQLAAHERSSGIVRIGGYRGEPITDSSPAVLLELTFQVLSMDGSDILFLLTNAVDDIEGIQSVPGRIFLMSPAEPQYIKERKEAPVLKK